MVSIANQTVYTGFGLRLASDFPLPELLPAPEREGRADVVIEREDLAGIWKECGAGDAFHGFHEGALLLNVPDVALYRIRNGNRIGYTPKPGAEEKAVRLYLLGSCMGAALLQRKILPLHGSAIVIGGQAFAFVGDSGAGKSTLAAAFIKRGYPLLSDDVIPVAWNREQAPAAFPSYPQQKLWQESIELLGLNRERCVPLYASKYAIPVSLRFCKTPVPLAAVFELGKTDRAEAELSRLQGLERLPTLQYHTYRRFLVARMDLARWHFAASAAIASRVRMYRLRRPAAGIAADELVDRILNAVERD